jgi:2-keto-4-pentenoate hydratase/2-oxohepta-3-ene-1,7-dioic acid hydratase in catechol pathway
MRFLGLHLNGRVEPAVAYEGDVIHLRGAGFSDIDDVIAGGPDAWDRVRRWIQKPYPGALEAAGAQYERLAAPLQRIGKIICIGLNYRDHAEEAKMAIPETPTVFSKWANTVIGHGHPIVLPRNSTKPDYEAELAVVIGKRGRHIAEADWREHVFGYTILNDVSARDFQMATSQWTIGKTFDTFAPIGPWIVSADEIPDPGALKISLTLSGETMQDSSTGNLIFGIPKLIAYLSSVMTLQPGDVISTGTPAGVGFARKPPRWLKPGDTVSVQVEGIGELTNPVIAEK